MALIAAGYDDVGGAAVRTLASERRDIPGTHLRGQR